MTEQEWLTSKEPSQMLWFLRDKDVSPRKLHLFTAACLRLGWVNDYLLEIEGEIIETEERYADGLVSVAELYAILRRMYQQMEAWDDIDDHFSWANGYAYDAAKDATTSAVGDDADEEVWEEAFESVCAAQCQRLRDIFGNPFRPVTIDPAWLTPDVTALAQAIYEERSLPDGTLDTTGLAILGDALEEAGCTSDDILNHCRSAGPHVRGCWVVDLLLAKE